MEIQPVTSIKVTICDVDLSGSKVHAGVTITTPEGYNQVELDSNATAISEAIAEVFDYLNQETEYCWTGVFRVVLISSPTDKLFSIEFFYDVMLFGGYTEEDLEELKGDILERLSELEACSDTDRFKFDFRIGKSFTT